MLAWCSDFSVVCTHLDVQDQGALLDRLQIIKAWRPPKDREDSTAEEEATTDNDDDAET